MNSNQLIGVGLRPPHYGYVIEKKPSIGWFEVHSENFLSKGGLVLDVLYAIREHYPLSLHGVGLSLGSSTALSRNHLIRLKKLIESISPFLVSEHLSWGYIDGVYMPDLLPIPYTNESLKVFSKNVDITQNFLKREILIENPSSYIEYKATDQEEVDFLVTLCKQTGAKILLDVNNVFVSCSNHGWNVKKYIDVIPENLVKEIHIAGHSIKKLPNDQILRVDTHNNYVCDEVWGLYDYAIQRFGPMPTLLEWDADIPSFDVLAHEALKCEVYFSACKTNVRIANA